MYADMIWPKAERFRGPLLLAAAAGSLAVFVALPQPAHAQFVCFNDETSDGDGADASGANSNNFACGTRADASGRRSRNTATGNRADANGDDSINTATGNTADAFGDDSSNTATGSFADANGDICLASVEPNVPNGHKLH